jgi:hypothetical protein
MKKHFPLLTENSVIISSFQEGIGYAMSILQFVFEELNAVFKR